MTVDLKIMLQRRGASVDLPTLEEGQLGITLDSKNMYYGLGNENIKVISSTSIEDTLTSDDSTKVLSAKQGNILNAKIQNVQSYVQDYMDNFDATINEKQDVILVRSDTAPSVVDMIWYSTGN